MVLHFDELDNFLFSYSYKCHYHLLCGDFNAHTGVMDEVQWRSDDSDRYLTIETDFDADFNTLGLPKRRTNEDITQDRTTYGKKLVDVCKNNCVLIYNGRLGEDREVGEATTTYKTTVDYMIGSWDLTRYVTKFHELDFDPVFSDVHSRLKAELQFQNEIEDSDAIASTQEANNLQRNVINQSIMGGIRRGARCLAYPTASLLAVTACESPCRLPSYSYPVTPSRRHRLAAAKSSVGVP